MLKEHFCLKRRSRGLTLPRSMLNMLWGNHQHFVFLTGFASSGGQPTLWDKSTFPHLTKDNLWIDSWRSLGKKEQFILAEFTQIFEFTHAASRLGLFLMHLIGWDQFHNWNFYGWTSLFSLVGGANSILRTFMAEPAFFSLLGGTSSILWTFRAEPIKTPCMMDQFD